MALIDETSGPGRPVDGQDSWITNRMLGEIGQALGHSAGYTPTLDEVLQEIRRLRKEADDRATTRLGEEQDEDVPYVHVVADKTVTWGAFGMTVVGYPADDVLKIRQAYVAERQS